MKYQELNSSGKDKKYENTIRDWESRCQHSASIELSLALLQQRFWIRLVKVLVNVLT